MVCQPAGLPGWINIEKGQPLKCANQPSPLNFPSSVTGNDREISVGTNHKIVVCTQIGIQVSTVWSVFVIQDLHSVILMEMVGRCRRIEGWAVKSKRSVLTICSATNRVSGIMSRYPLFRSAIYPSSLWASLPPW